MVLGSFQCRGVLLIWIFVGKGPIDFAVGVWGVDCGRFNISLPYIIILFFLPLSGRPLDID